MTIKTTDTTIKAVATHQTSQKGNSTNQQPCRLCSGANNHSGDCQACFNCGRMGHTSIKSEQY